LKITYKHRGRRALIKIISALVALLMASGCYSIPKPNYLYDANQKDPVLVFTSDFALATDFFVNIDPASDNSCQEFRRVGHIKNEDPWGTYGEQVKEFRRQVPADQVVTVRAVYGDDYNPWGRGDHCGPVYASFTPKKGGAYRVNMTIIPDRAGPPGSDGSELLGMALGLAIGAPYTPTYKPRMRDTNANDSDLAKIFGGTRNGRKGFFGPAVFPPYGFCSLGIWIDDDNETIVQERIRFRTCKPSKKYGGQFIP
jgi:hypothetical protein